ncbi:MAG: MFS transporter [Pseudomonadota bacterium]|nr:MFS transporter [Pseudomonadota bacterium]
MKQLPGNQLGIRALIAAIVLGTVGALTIMIVPGFVMLVGSHSQLDDRQLGFVAAWDINATAVAIGLATFLIARVSWRRMAFAGLGLIAIGQVATALSHDYFFIVASRVCAGLGEGLAIAVSFAALGCAPNPDRAFGIYLVVGLSVSAALLALLPELQGTFGPAAVFMGLGIATLASALLLTWLPRCNPAIEQWQSTDARLSIRLALPSLLGVFLYFIAQGAMWSYFERIGSASGVQPAIIGQAMGISSLAGVGGALLAAWICTSLGRILPLSVSGALSLLSFWLLHGQVSATALMASGILLNFAWNLAQPLLSGICANADARGRVVVAMGCIQTIGFGVGPALAAVMLRGQDFSAAIWMSTIVLTTSLLIVTLGIRSDRRPPVALPLRVP